MGARAGIGVGADSQQSGVAVACSVNWLDVAPPAEHPIDCEQR